MGGRVGERAGAATRRQARLKNVAKPMSNVAAHANVQRLFKARLIAREPLLGTFLKTAAPHATEILGEIGYDFVVVDAEHAPFSRTEIDVLMLAARAANIASLVRVQLADPAQILSVLDCGAAGVLVPHVKSATVLQGIVSACTYRGGSRGFSNSPRAGGYGTLGLHEHIALGDETVTVLAMIEDPEAVEAIDEIFAVPGLTGAFIGRGDLSASLGVRTMDDPLLAEAVMRITEAAKRHNVPLLAHVGSGGAPDVAALRAQGVTAFIAASDQGLMRQGALASRQAFDKI
jgi:2-keto-3-deoxy-L-rhamnonate aldolase RhmA